MKNITKNIITYILGFITALGIGVYAATRYMSKDISYTKKDGTVTNVEDAINDLYNNRINEDSFADAITSASYGSRLVNRNTSIDVEKGKYIIAATNSFVNGGNTNITFYKDIYISCNNCTYKSLSNLGARGVGTALGTAYYATTTFVTLYYVDVTSTDTIIVSHSDPSAVDMEHNGQSVIINAVKIK